MRRVIAKSVAMIAFCLAVLGNHERISSVCHAQETQGSADRRVLRFPTERSVGVVRIGRLKGPSVVLDFEQLECKSARGDIEVSAEDFVELRVGTVDDLEFLEQLSPNALQCLKISKMEMDQKALACITGLEGLKSLELDSCEFKEDVFENAKSLPSLRALTVYATNFDGLSFALWMAKLPKLDFLYARPSLDNQAYRNLSGHPALATTTIDIANDQIAWPLQQVQLPALRELIINCEDKASARSLDGISALADLESISIMSGTVDGELLKKIAALGSVRRLKLIYNKLGPNFFDGLETLSSLEHFEFYLSNTRGVDPTSFKKHLALSILKLPRIKSIPQIGKPSLEVFEQIIARKHLESLDIDEWDDKIPFAKLESLSQHKELKTLKLSSISITDGGLQFLSGLEGLRMWNVYSQAEATSEIPKSFAVTR